VEKQAKVIAKLEAPAADADADADDAEQPPVPMVNAADDAVAPIYGGGGVREASAERGPTSGSSGPDEGMWRDDEASSDETFDMGTNMAFLGDKVPPLSTRNPCSALRFEPENHSRLYDQYPGRCTKNSLNPDSAP